VSFIATTKHSTSGQTDRTASLRSVVKVAIPHWRGAWVPTIAIFLIALAGGGPRESAPAPFDSYFFFSLAGAVAKAA
jgi:hypothetical protein